jgi:tartronate-semialdehyde synthase
VAAAEEHRRPVLVEIITERETNAPMGTALDAIVEFDPADREFAEPALEA